MILTEKLKEVIVMLKLLLNKAGFYLKSTLGMIEWVAFIGSFCVSEPIIMVMLQIVARVLP